RESLPVSRPVVTDADLAGYRANIARGMRGIAERQLQREVAGTVALAQPAAQAKPKSGSFSRAVPTVADGMRFASKMEALVYQRLKLELRPGQRLYCQVRFPLV